MDTPVRASEGVPQTGTQRIGWYPRSRGVRSWWCNSDGSFGDGSWTKSGDEWFIKSSQTLADGRAASGTFVLSRVDNDSVTLRLIGHEVDGEPQLAGKTVSMIRTADDISQAAGAEPSGEDEPVAPAEEKQPAATAPGDAKPAPADAGPATEPSSKAPTNDR